MASLRRWLKLGGYWLLWYFYFLFDFCCFLRTYLYSSFMTERDREAEMGSQNRIHATIHLESPLVGIVSSLAHSQHAQGGQRCEQGPFSWVQLCYCCVTAGSSSFFILPTQKPEERIPFPIKQETVSSSSYQMLSKTGLEWHFSFAFHTVC